jgi:peptide/nickel transport system ATP-binding protein
MTANVLEIRDLHVQIGRGRDAIKILRGVDLTVKAGEIRGLVGESGGGKTMVGKAVTGLLPGTAVVSSGAIRFEGRDVLGLPAGERRALLGRKIAMILQQPSTALNPVIRIEPQITDVLRSRLGYSRAAARGRALELLELVHIRSPERVLQQYPHELSGGMCQRVVIAIAFAGNPSLIVADEPTTALDVTVQFEILKLIRNLQRRTGTAVLFITHDLGVVAKICESVSVIFAGRILEQGSADDVFSRPAHPYTRALIAASPRFDRPEAGLHPVSAELTAQLWREATAYDLERGHA